MNRKTRGQSLVEFALILPILLLLILGIIEGARIIWAYITVQNAAREAARYAITGQPYDESGNPWTLRPDRYLGCDPQFTGDGQLIYSPDLVGGGDCTGPNDRVDAIIGVALERGRQLGVDQYAIQAGVYTATGWVDTGGTFGVRVFGQETGGDTRVDYAGKEGLNVLVQVYYNVRILDPLYAAIIPSGYVHLAGEVQMQNEGIDAALGSLPPGGIAPPEAPEGSEYEPGETTPPVVLSLDGSTVDAGSDLRVKLEYHPANQRYDVYLYSISLGYVAICLDLQTDAFGSVSQATCNVPATTTPGSYQLVSIPVGGDPDPANHVGEGDLIDVVYPGQPLISIRQGNRWPPGSTITFDLLGHQPCPPGKSPCPPNQEYDIALIGGVFPSPGQVIGTVRVDDLGSASLTWAIPTWLAPGVYTVVTYERDTIDPVIASTTLEIVRADIVVQGGNRWPAGSTIRVHLRGHAANRTYRLRWIDGQTGATTDFGPVTTDQFGNTQAPVQFRIPSSTADSPPNHRIISFEDGGSGEEVASTEVEVYTPEDALIVVVGGDKWPAGSLIQIELHAHHNGPYDLYFEDTLIESGISPNASGFYQTTYVIPVATPDGMYELRTRRVSGGAIEATKTIEVESVPLIRLKEGSIVQPLSRVTVELLHHVPNDSFQIYLDGNFLFSLPTNAVGGAERVYDLSNLPGLRGGPFLLESRSGGLTVASTEVYILAADLMVTDIEFPPGPPVDVEIPVTVTVFNNSPVPVSGEWFDVDLYLNPVHEPTTASQFPPGDYKRWLYSIPATGTAQVVFSLTLSSIDYTVYGRVDTSNYIIETNDANNIYQTQIAAACAIELEDEFGSAASASSWTATDYGNADIPPSNFSVSGGTLNLVSDGSSSWGTSDNTYFVYYNQPVIGNFDVRVRMVEGPGDDAGERNWAKAGLEIRADVGAANSSKVYIAGANSDHHGGWDPAVQSAYRDGAGTETYRPADASVDAAISYPIWLRIVREGDRFEYYFSDSDSATPPADNAWTAHGSVQMSNMPAMVTIGLFNASYDSGNGTDTSSFDSFHVCVQDDIACGPVDAVDGQVVLEAINYTANIPRSGHQWQQYTWGGSPGMKAMPDSGLNQNTNYAANSPELQYQANFDASGTYYVWVYGRGPSGDSDSVHVGLDGAEIATADRISSFPSSSVNWSNSTMDGVRASIDVPSAGLHTLNVWMREDGFEIYKLLLTNDPNFTPSGNIDQSPCQGTQPGGGEQIPPGLMICTGDLIQNGGFEETQLAPWTVPNGGVNKIPEQYEGVFAAVMHTYNGAEHLQPALGQTFDMPDWIISTTTSINLSFYQCVRDGWPGSGAEPNDRLMVGLRSTGVTPTLITTATQVANGNTTVYGPSCEGDYANYSTDLAAAMTANPELYQSQRLELFFYDTSNDLGVCNGPGGGPANASCYETDYFLDEVELEVCTTQPIPPHEPGKATIGGPLRVFLSGAPIPKPGVRVWTYKQNGELLTTYSLHDSNYFFYNIDPGEYVIYSEYWDGPNLYSAFTTVTVGPDEIITNLSLLLR
ncbi:MAG: hypothetical protein Kow0063_00810 [Anaerolineae bacterium]